MPFHLFQYPLPGTGDLSDLNAFLAAQPVVQVQQHLVPTSAGATLVFVVQTTTSTSSQKTKSSSGKKIDYRAELSAEDFTVFSHLRDERKRIAEAEGVPLYTVFTNEQLAALARNRPTTLTALATTEGIGKARVEKHGPALLQILNPASQAQPSA